MASSDTKDIGYFAAVARCGGFRAAAAATGVSAGALSKAVSRLERHIGLPLFLRTSKAAGLTDEGRKLFEGVQHTLGALDQCMVALKGQEQSQGSTLRIGVTAGFFYDVLAPVLPGFQLRYPQTRLLISLGARPWHNPAEHFDLWLASGRETGDGANLAVLKPFQKRLLASPAYLDRHGWPEGPDDIARHECITCASHSGRHMTWFFRHEGGGDVIEVQPFGNLQMTNTAGTMLALAELGLGLVLGSRQEAAPYLAASMLVNVLPGYGVTEDEDALQLVCQKGSQASPMAQSLLEQIASS